MYYNFNKQFNKTIDGQKVSFVIIPKSEYSTVRNFKYQDRRAKAYFDAEERQRKITIVINGETKIDADLHHYFGMLKDDEIHYNGRIFANINQFYKSINK